MKEALDKYEKGNQAEFYDLMALTGYFEDVGTLVTEGYFDKQQVKKFVGDSLKHYYTLFRSWIDETRHEAPDSYKEWQSLLSDD